MKGLRLLNFSQGCLSSFRSIQALIQPTPADQPVPGLVLFLELGEVGLINPPLRVLSTAPTPSSAGVLRPEETAYLLRLNKLPGDPLRNRRQFIASRRRLATLEKLGQLRFSIEFVFGVLIIQRAFRARTWS